MPTRWDKLTPAQRSVLLPRHLARQKLRYLVKTGKIKKPDSCCKCGTVQPKRLIDGHHHNGYEAWDDVVWLCKKCHTEVDHGVLERTPKNNNTSGYTGITRNTGRGRPWIARIDKGGIRYSLGCFDSIEEAIKARELKSAELYPPP